MTKLIKKDYFIIAFGVLAILPFFLISTFNHPSADDFCFYIKSRDLGFWDAQWDWYNNWTGRYFSTFVLSIKSIMSGSFFWYKIVPIGLLLTFGWSIYYLCSLLFTSLKTNNLLIITFCFFVVYIIQMPSVAQGFYWMPGSITYLLSNILTVVFLGFIVQLFKTTKSRYVLLSIVTLCFIIGCNETTMLLVDVLVAIIFIYRFFDTKKIDLSMLILLIFAIAFSMIVIWSPGNVVRTSHLPPNKHQFFESVFDSILAVKKYMLHWSELIILFTLIFYNYFDEKIDVNLSKIFNVNPIVVFIVVFSIPFIGFFPGYWSLGGQPPLRTINTIYFFFLLGFIYFTFVLFYYLKQRQYKFIQFSRWVNYLLLILLFSHLFQNNNIKTAYSDLFSGKAYRYDLELKRRYDMIKQSTKDTLYIQKLKYKPATIYFDDITSNPEDWRNKCYDSYFGHAIIIEEN